MKPYVVIKTVLLAAVLAFSMVRAAEISATGISMPFFNDAGKLTHRMMAKTAVKTGPVQELRGIEIHYFAPNDPKLVVQKIQASDATWNDRKGTLTGSGQIVVATVESRLDGDGFDFAVDTSVLEIHRNFTMTNPEVRLTSDRARIELIVEQSADDFKVRDVKRCDAIGNLHIVVQPAAQPKYRIKEAFSELAIYDGAKQTIRLPRPTRTVQADGGTGHFETFTINLRDEAGEPR